MSKGVAIDPHIPCYIVKNNLALIKLSSLDFRSLLKKTSVIFFVLHKYKMKVDLIQNSAISFSVCVFDKFGKIERYSTNFVVDFKWIINQMSHYTIRHFQPESAAFLLRKNELLLEQRTQETMQLVGVRYFIESVLLHKRKCIVFDFFSCSSKSRFDFFIFCY